MNQPVRDRILSSTYACVARSGLAKTTIEDAAREAGLSRATVYRHFPGGRDQLIAEVIGWETTRFFVSLAEAVVGAVGFVDLIEQALSYAHQAVESHDVLQKILQTEPERLLPTLTVQSDRIRPLIASFLLPYLEDLGELRVAPAEAADYVARVVLSYIASPGRWDLTDRDQVATLVRTEFLSGVLDGAPSGR